ncbi:hypothetical protein HD554DRAFT_2166924 [Boletus coccyginus]|nr:hypothetical protein HD554DRAFT_2166924 [Boletus coccyginus]
MHPPAPTSSTSPLQDTPSFVPSYDSDVHSSRSNTADDDELTWFFTAAFKLLADSVSHLPDSEDKRKISNILRGFSEVLPGCEAAPVNLNSDEDADAAP